MKHPRPELLLYLRTILALAGVFPLVAPEGRAQVPTVDVHPFAAQAASPNRQTAPTTPTTTQVAIEAYFVKIGLGDFDFKDLAQFGTGGTAAANASSEASQWIGRLDVPALLKALAQKPGYELIGRPAITTLPGSSTYLCGAQELSYPESFSETGTPQEFCTRNVGIELKATPKLDADGHTIDLELNSRLTELDGFMQFGNNNIQPIFSTNEMLAKVSVPDGATLAMGGMPLAEKAPSGIVSAAGGIEKIFNGSPNGPKKRMLLLLITVRIFRQDKP